MAGDARVVAGHGCAADERDRRAGASGAAGDFRGRRMRPADCLRQRRVSHAGAIDRTQPRARGARSAWREPWPAGARDLRRVVAARLPRGLSWRATRHRRRAGLDRHGAAPSAALARDQSGCGHARVRHRADVRDRPALRPAAGLVWRPNQSRDSAARRRAHGCAGRPQPRLASCARRRAARLVLRPVDLCRVAGADVLPRAAESSRIPHGWRVDGDVRPARGGDALRPRCGRACSLPSEIAHAASRAAGRHLGRIGCALALCRTARQHGFPRSRPILAGRKARTRGRAAVRPQGDRVDRIPGDARRPDPGRTGVRRARYCSAARRWRSSIRSSCDGTFLGRRSSARASRTDGGLPPSSAWLETSKPPQWRSVRSRSSTYPWSRARCSARG